MTESDAEVRVMAETRGRIVTAARTATLSFAAVLCGLLAVPTAAAHHSITYTLVGTPGNNGWFRSDVTIQWSITHPADLTSTSGCEPGTRVTTEGASTRTCLATAGDHTVSLAVTLQIDKTLPSVPTGTPARAPDANGWYNQPVGVSFAATDAVSGHRHLRGERLQRRGLGHGDRHPAPVRTGPAT